MAAIGTRWVKRWRTKEWWACADGREQPWALLEVAAVHRFEIEEVWVATPVFRDGPPAKRAKIEDPFDKAVTEAVKQAKIEAGLAQKAQDHDSSALSTSSSSTARTSTNPETVWVRRVTGITPEAVAASSQSQEA